MFDFDLFQVDVVPVHSRGRAIKHWTGKHTNAQVEHIDESRYKLYANICEDNT